MYQKYRIPYMVLNYVGNVGLILEDKKEVKKMRRSELIARLNTIRFEIETSGIKSNNYNLETIETCLYYFLDEEDADPHWD